MHDKRLAGRIVDGTWLEILGSDKLLAYNKSGRKQPETKHTRGEYKKGEQGQIKKV